jgi:hypothetical protein
VPWPVYSLLQIRNPIHRSADNEPKKIAPKSAEVFITAFAAPPISGAIRLALLVVPRSHFLRWGAVGKNEFDPMHSRNPGVIERADDGLICAFFVEFERRCAICSAARAH